MSVPNVIQDVIAVIKQKLELSPKSDKVLSISLWDFQDDKGDTIPKDDLLKVFRKLEEDKIINMLFTEHFRYLWRKAEDKVEFEINKDEFEKYYSKNKGQPPITNQDDTTSSLKESYPTELKLKVVDREVWVNNYLIAKPHAVGNNYDFLEYVRKQPFDQPITKDSLTIDIQEAMGDKTFFKILNALGFKGEIKRAFFYKVDARTLCYRGDNLTLLQLKDAGVNIKLLIKQLEVADAKYNPV
jgi:hypothetical protein